MALANLDGAPMSLAGVRHERLRMRRAGVLPLLLQAVGRQATMQSLRLLSGVDLLADASDSLSALSGGLASITGDTHWQERSSSRRSAEESSVAGALVHGGEALAAGVFRGLSGVVTKPLSGAKKAGISGFLQGVARGAAGLVLQPVSGAVDFGGKVVEGVSVGVGQVSDAVAGSAGITRRRRPPLAVRPDGLLRCYDPAAAEGQAMLRLAEWRSVGSAGGLADRLDLGKYKSRFAQSDAYEAHEALPDGRVALVTSARVLLLERPAPGADPLTERRSIAWAVEFAQLLRAWAEGPTVNLVLRSRTKDRLLGGGGVSARSVTFATGQQADRLHAAVEAGLRALADSLAGSLSS